MTDPVIIAVVSSYRPPPSLVDNVLTVMGQVSAVVVADDGSGPDAEPVLARLKEIGADVLRKDTNEGIAATLNAGIARAREHHRAAWIITLDQDTALHPDYVQHLLRTAVRASADGLHVGAVSYAEQNGRPVARLEGTSGHQQAYDPMQSGLLLPVGTFDMVGGLREDLFIDWVDTEFNERMRAEGLSTLIAEGTNLDHSLGDMRTLTVFGRPLVRNGRHLSVAYHPPVRAYYMARNGLLVARTTLCRAPLWTVSRLLHDAIGHLARITVGPHRSKHLQAVFFGVIDGAHQRSGKITASRQRRLS